MISAAFIVLLKDVPLRQLSQSFLLQFIYLEATFSERIVANTIPSTWLDLH